MSEEQRLQALLLLGAMLGSVERLERDFAKLKKAAVDFRDDLERNGPLPFKGRKV